MTVVAADGNFDATDVGQTIAGTGIPAGAYITSINSATSVEISANATLTQGPTLPASCFGSANGFVPGTTTALTPTPLCTPVTLTIGSPSLTAPVNNDVVASLQTSLQLDPNLVAGSDLCSANTYEGFTISGTWTNLPATGVPSNASGAIAKVDYPTAVVTFSGYVVPRYSGDAVQASEHVDLVYPLVPTDIANCVGGDIVSTFKFNGTAVSQQKLPTGTGQPSSAQVRGIDDSSGSKTLTWKSDETGTTYTDTCTVPASYTFTGTGDAFPCGD
jgi:hypothetical protein